MIGVKATTEFDAAQLRRRQQAGAAKSIGHALALIRRAARQLIRKRKAASPEGKPPSTRGAQRLKRAILYFVDHRRQSGVVGPSFRIVGIAGAQHEHGLAFGREVLGQRSFMAPALEKIAPKIAGQFAGSV